MGTNPVKLGSDIDIRALDKNFVIPIIKIKSGKIFTALITEYNYIQITDIPVPKPFLNIFAVNGKPQAEQNLFCGQLFQICLNFGIRHKFGIKHRQGTGSKNFTVIINIKYPVRAVNHQRQS